MNHFALIENGVFTVLFLWDFVGLFNVTFLEDASMSVFYCTSCFYWLDLFRGKQLGDRCPLCEEDLFDLEEQVKPPYFTVVPEAMFKMHM